MGQKNLQLQALVATIVLLASFLIAIPATGTEEPNHTKATITSTVVEVYDGDTVKLANGMEVRLPWIRHNGNLPSRKASGILRVQGLRVQTGAGRREKVKLEYDVKEKDQ